REMTRGSGCGALLSFEAIPFMEGARELAREGFVPGGSKRNLEYLRPELQIVPGLHEGDVYLLADAQTSGGLLLAVDPAKRDYLLQALGRHGAQGWDIGEVVAESTLCVTL
ncbi:MAG: selenide, water dikinase SelD, partial [Cyanobacteria bacterium REEB65]|nr:selenide, water dikinase SelD [Cyanobacteria bacterium REEB65]